MPRRRRSPLGCLLRLFGFVASYVFAAVLVAGERRWNRPPPRRAALLLLVLAVACASAPWARFEVAGIVASGEATTAGARVHVLVGARLVTVRVDRDTFDRLRRGDHVTVTGEARGRRLRYVAVQVASGVAV